MELVAQENIKAVLKKHENHPKVDINYTIEKKNPNVKDDHPTEGKQEIFQIIIRENEDADVLLKEFEKAFEKDREKAIKISESKRGGKLSSATYQFEKITYSFIFFSNMTSTDFLIKQTP